MSGQTLLIKNADILCTIAPSGPGNLNDASEIRSSTGIGLNLLTPIGPLSFSLSQPINKKSSDKTETFRFNLGTTF